MIPKSPKSPDPSNYAASFCYRGHTKEKCTGLGGTGACPAQIQLKELRTSGEVPEVNIMHATVRCWEDKGEFWHRFITYPTKEDCRCLDCTKASATSSTEPT